MISNHTSTLRRTLGLALAVGLLALAGCADATDLQADRAENAETATQNLGESTTAYAFNGVGADAMPNLPERQAVHLMNRVRMDSVGFGLEDMNGNPIPPNTPAIFSPTLTEAGRWQGQHLLTTGCNCPTNPMAGPPAYNSCCEMGKVGGKVQCVSGQLACNDENTATEQDRWNLLATGKASISAESWSSSSLTPEEVQDPCQTGTCTNQSSGANLCTDEEQQNNPMCEGVCFSEEECDGVCTNQGSEEAIECTLPDPPDPVRTQLPGEFVAFQLLQNSTALSAVISSSNSAMGISHVSGTETPQECRIPEDPCETGNCKNQSSGAELCDAEEKENNPDCAGVCVSQEECGGVCERSTAEGGTEPITCTIPEAPDPVACQEERYPRGFRMNLLGGATPEPIPPVLDGIHMQLGITANEDRPDGLFGVTPPNQTLFTAHYYDPSGDAQSATVAVDGQCNEMSMASDGMVADGMGGMTYTGHRYEATSGLEPGCHRYVFSFQDSDGFIYTYPSYGSLGANIGTRQNEGGTTFNVVIPNDDSCPVWAPERPDLSCLPEGDQCVQGETRPCYTGRTNTRGQGICTMGTESCENGRWSGVCSGQTLPEADEVCDDDVDNDCNGYINEGCEDGGGDNGGGDNGGSGTDSGGCNAGSQGGGPLGPTALLTALLGGALLRRRR